MRKLSQESSVKRKSSIKMENQKQIQNINIGSKIGLSFDLGKVEHPVYGKAYLSGIIPLILPYGTYIEPEITKEPKRLETMVAKLIPEFRDLWYNDLDEEVSAKIRDFILMASYINPIHDIETKQMQAFMYLISLGFAADDIIDDAKRLPEGFWELDAVRNFRKSRSHIYNPDIDTINEIEIPVPNFEYVKPFAKKLRTLCETSIQDFHKNSKYVKEDLFDVFCAVLLNVENVDAKGQLSRTSKLIFSGYQAGPIPLLEFVALIWGVKVSDEIRMDILFQRMRIAGAKTTHMMNDIFGCGRDIRLNLVNDSTILSQVVHDGIPLQTVFDQMISEISDEINDFRILCKMLRQYYWDDKDLLEYINIAERGIHGELYVYSQVHRYGDLNIKVVSNE